MHPDLHASLATIVSFRTIPGANEEKVRCREWIAKNFFASSRIALDQGEAAGVPYLFLRHPHPKLLWFAHFDVVPGTDAQFTLASDGDRALGRGVKDMKGAAITFLLAYRDLLARGIVPPVSVLLTSDEETGGHSLVALHERKLFGDVPVAFTPDTGEHPGIVTELKGAVWADVIAQGKSAHGAMPWFGTNPIPLLSHAINRLTEAYPPGSDADWRMTVTPTRLMGSDAFNKMPDAARCTFDVRFPATVCSSPAEALELLRPLLPAGCTIEAVTTADPLFTDPNHPMVQRIKRLAEAMLGKPVPLHRENGSSDARTFGSRGIPAFLYGPDGGDLHGAAEWVSLRSLQQHVELNTRLLEELASEAS